MSFIWLIVTNKDNLNNELLYFIPLYVICMIMGQFLIAVPLYSIGSHIYLPAFRVAIARDEKPVLFGIIWLLPTVIGLLLLLYGCTYFWSDYFSYSSESTTEGLL